MADRPTIRVTHDGTRSVISFDPRTPGLPEKLLEIGRREDASGYAQPPYAHSSTGRRFYDWSTIADAGIGEAHAQFGTIASVQEVLHWAQSQGCLIEGEIPGLPSAFPETAAPSLEPIPNAHSRSQPPTGRLLPHMPLPPHLHRKR
jgi:hypothetical protein